MSMSYVEYTFHCLFNPFIGISLTARRTESTLTGEPYSLFFKTIRTNILGVTIGGLSAADHFFNIFNDGLPVKA